MLHTPPLGRAYVRVVAACLAAYFGIYHRLTVEGEENIPRCGPLLFLINHVSLLEPFAAGSILMNRGIWPREHFYAVGKKELFAFPPAAWFLRSLGLFPIDRERADMAAMRNMLTMLRENKIVGIAPEGTRSPTGKLQAFQPVVAKIAISRRVPILPVGVIGAEKAMPVGSPFPRPFRITVRFGHVFELSEFYDRELPEALAEQASWMIREHVAALLPEWMRELPPPVERVGARRL